MNLQESLSQFSRHTPRLLRRQLILQLTEQYLGKDNGTEDSHLKFCAPSIQRFHGALLQLKVLGLSILSLNLGAEELKNLVNEYFSKILEIVERHGGDVVRFSGDVFLVVWEDAMSTDGDSKCESDEMAKATVAKATACAQEISISCSNHRVVLGGEKSVRSSSYCTSLAGPSAPHSWQDGGAVPKEPGATVAMPKPVYDISGHRRSGEEEEDELFLNTRMAISSGLLAGIDIGSDNRWEYFLIGEPVTKVDEVVGEAAAGEVVLCGESHALLHPTAGAGKISRLLTRVKSALLRTNSSLEAGGPRRLSCGCSQLKTGHCALPPAPAPSPTKPKLRKARTGTSNRLVTEDTTASSAIAMHDATRCDIEEAFNSHLALFSEEFTRLQVSLGIVCDAQGTAGDERLQSTFSKWAQRCLIDDLARHVHPVVWGEHVFADVSRSGSYLRAVEEQLFGKSVNASIAAAAAASHQGASRSTSGSPAPPLSSPSASRLGPLRLWGTSSATASPSLSRTASPLTAPITFPTPSHTPRSRPLSPTSDDELATVPVSRPGVVSPPRGRPRASTHDSPSTLPALLPRSTTASPAMVSSPVVSRTPSVDGERDSFGSSSPGASFHRPALNRAATVGTGSETSIHRRALVSGGGAVGLGNRRDSSLLRSSLAHGTSASRALVEVRAASVLSVRIELPDVELLVDGTRRQKTGGGPRFLARTVNERCADKLLLNRFQGIIEAVNETFARFGGQLKQFVVEGKTAVCVGTFGLRGSVSDDNATASLEAAHAMSEDLRARSVRGSIGVALGRASCFVAGSPNRQAYAVVGPAIQLSEHLMKLAPSVGVLCDRETRQRDHSHGFLALDISPPRGFTQAVDAFVPVFPDASSSAKEEQLASSASLVSLPAAESDHVNPSGAAHSIESALVLRQLLKSRDVLIGGPTTGEQSRMGLHGREKDWKDLLEFLLSPLVTHASSSDNTTNVMTISRPGAPVKPIFDHQLPSRSAGVIGTFGVGKSSLVASIVERLAVVTRCNAGCNIHLFKNRLDNFRQEALFGAWKPIIIAMMTKLYRIQDAATKKRRKSLVVGTTAASLELTRSVDFVCSLLPAALEKYRPLFGFMGILPSDESLASLRLTLAEKVARSVELLLAVIRLFVKKCKALAVVVLDNIHTIDRPSLCLLLEVSAATHGVVVLFAGRTTAGSHNALHELTSSLLHSDRHLTVDLPELSKEAITALVGDVFKMRKGASGTSGHAVTSLCDKVFESSGGNPFYAYEIAKSASEHQNQTWDASLTAVHSIRVEEVICHRFDQLKASAQSLLKMAAVACSNGLPVSLELLYELDDADLLLEDLDRTQQNCTELAITLHEVLGCESFLRVVGRNDLQTEVTLDTILEGQHFYEFAIPLEQSTIYGLLMEDQKHAIHERVASHLNERHLDRSTAADLQEEAHHWQGACVFGRAMTCYFRAYQAEGDAERRSVWLSRAYSIYLHRKENTELVPDPVGISLSHLSGMLDDTMRHDGQSSTHSDPAFNVVFTLERVFQIFNGDSNLLATGIEVLLAVAEERTSRSEDAHRTQLLLEDALQFVLLTKQPFLLSTGYVSSVVNQVNVVAAGKQTVVPTGDDVHFHLPDFWPVCFRVLSAYVLNDAQSSNVTAEYFRKVGFVAAQSIALARKDGGKHYLLQALCVECLVFFKMGDTKKALEVVGEISSLHAAAGSSALLIDTYGYDIVPYVLVTAASHLLLSGAEVLAESLLQSCLCFVRTSTHALSVAHCLLPLLALLSYRGRYLDAYEVLTAFDRLARADAAQVDALLPRKVIQLYFEWLSKRLALSHSSAGATSPTSHQKSQSLEELQSAANEVHSQKELFGSGLLGHHQHDIELVLADLWVLRAAEAGADAAKCSHSCGVHLAHVLRSKARGVAQHFFNKASAVKIALDIVSRMPAEAKDQCISELKRVFSVAAVSDLTMEAHQSHLEALCEDLGRLQHLLFDPQSATGVR